MVEEKGERRRFLKPIRLSSALKLNDNNRSLLISVSTKTLSHHYYHFPDTSFVRRCLSTLVISTCKNHNYNHFLTRIINCHDFFTRSFANGKERHNRNRLASKNFASASAICPCMHPAYINHLAGAEPQKDNNEDIDSQKQASRIWPHCVYLFGGRLRCLTVLAHPAKKQPAQPINSLDRSP